MRHLRLALALAATSAFGGCFQMTSVVKVSGDASGTFDQRLVFSQGAIRQLKQFSALGGSDSKPFDPVSEEQARADAAKLGPGTVYVSSTVINDETGQGRATVYAFTDINQLRLSPRDAKSMSESPADDLRTTGRKVSSSARKHAG